MFSRKRNSVIYRFASLLLVLMLSACSALQGTPQPAPPVTDVLIHLKYEKNREDIGLFGIWRD